MTRLFTVALLLSGVTAPTLAQDARFPLGKPFKVISISGFDCNSWTANVALRDDQVDFTNIVTTKKMCPKPHMTSEQAFLTTLKSAQRWRVDDKGWLVVEGETARLLLTAGGADQQPAKKPDKTRKPAATPATR